MAEQHEGETDYGIYEADEVDGPRRSIARPRWIPDAAEGRYAYDGAGDVENARYDAAWRSPKPRE